MHIPASPRTEQLVADLMSTGRYKSQAELIEAALEALAGQESFDLIRAELEAASRKLATPELVELEEKAVEEIAQHLRELN